MSGLADSDRQEQGGQLANPKGGLHGVGSSPLALQRHRI
jgi:hypothetical protein